MITALPYPNHDISKFEIRPARVTRVVDEGDIVDLGDRHFEVLHLLGLDELPGSNIADYIRTMERLRDLPVRIVHAGHDPSFGRERLLELIDQYLERRRAA
jgi:glyoxylase-like metal-dependent hydrolase (beta-lactamase superfamily II)